MIVIFPLIFITIIIMTLIIASGEFDLEHRQSGTSHSVLPLLQKVPGDYDNDDNDDDDSDDEEDEEEEGEEEEDSDGGDDDDDEL